MVRGEDNLEIGGRLVFGRGRGLAHFLVALSSETVVWAVAQTCGSLLSSL
ncbi:protein of unknown function [Candidatus Filomicrobium marinum]|uniref:Uncharacterized protein n=1 Tax=Candidatus Filomicrobium marinum TaxID=1608628 RepID=A0A0D6JDV1_9HYPH|nr:protein of unknown function [Candidatus Filomicrobium marinum]